MRQITAENAQLETHSLYAIISLEFLNPARPRCPAAVPMTHNGVPECAASSPVNSTGCS